MLQKLIRHGCVIVAIASALLAAGCKEGASHGAGKGKPGKQAIQNIGSDTMVNLAQAWAEQYATVAPNISIEVSGGGTGVGVAALINGTVELANCSRRLTTAEFDKAKKATGKEPKEYLVGYDGLAVFVHKSNPINEISIEELADIYREGATITKWSELNVTLPKGATDKIVRVSRQNNSGTFQYFRETIVGKKDDLGLGSLDMNGSKEVVELIAQTISAIGYSGLGYATPQVKVLKISMKRGASSVVPSIATVHDKTYPISRPLYMYTPGVPSLAASQYLAWILSPAGQSIVRETGYIPLAQ
jgi:phosphate transport system substrate-binding protein